jgi:hypothetical protein
MFTLLAYAIVSESPDGMFYGPTSGRLILAKMVDGWGLIGLVFSADKNLQPGLSFPIGKGLITIIFDNRMRVDKFRNVNCASWMVLPVLGYDPTFEPPPAGVGRCLENGNFDL